ncbi:MAG: hypothetical protein GQ574_18965 [Crocinitomix sp.]|nr:hypothetical protein [Crocinitomix sp.]
MREITVIYIITLAVNIIFPFVFLDWDIWDWEGSGARYFWFTTSVQFLVILLTFIGKKRGPLAFLQLCTLIMAIINFLFLLFFFLLQNDFEGGYAHQYILFMLLQLAVFSLSIYHTTKNSNKSKSQ